MRFCAVGEQDASIKDETCRWWALNCGIIATDCIERINRACLPYSTPPPASLPPPYRSIRQTLICQSGTWQHAITGAIVSNVALLKFKQIFVATNFPVCSQLHQGTPGIDTKIMDLLYVAFTWDLGWLSSD